MARPLSRRRGVCIIDGSDARGVDGWRGSMLRDDQQLARACRALLATVRLERLWTEDGPTPEASELLEADGGPLSSGKRIVLLAAWTFWNGAGGLRLAEVLEQFDADPMDALCFLVMASKYGDDRLVHQQLNTCGNHGACHAGPGRRRRVSDRGDVARKDPGSRG